MFKDDDSTLTPPSNSIARARAKSWASSRAAPPSFGARDRSVAQVRVAHLVQPPPLRLHGLHRRPLLAARETSDEAANVRDIHISIARRAKRLGILTRHFDTEREERGSVWQCWFPYGI
jgi:hypothetical protein